ncbi:MAG TPA: hypothetical protein VN923_19010, partial [Thermoanaerobaculia bacterium]|nr:hypothetical protein [Thermoanaerobaculia bacterium]
SGVVDAFRRISGDVKRADKQRDETTHEEERGHKFELAGKELVAPAVAVLTGALAGLGTAASTGKPFTALVGGVVAALGAGLVFKVSTSRKRARSLAREEQFIPDLSVATLDRVLPLLIERLREAGLAPVFVVDELDKVQRLNERILEMVHHLKKLVAENAFFCFLANRSYFEEMLARSAGRAYPVEYTYYTHRLFVTFGPEDYERYLRKRMPDPEPSPAPAVAASGALEAAAVADTREPVACTLLRWVVRHRAQLHAVDLQREIAALRGESNEVAGEVDEIVTSQRNRIDATFQVAIELRLAQKEVQQAVRDRPELRRLLYDAMYYLTRRWLEGATEIDLTPKEPKQPNEAFDAFVKYLEGRTGREEERPADDGGAGAAAAGDAKATHGLQPGDCEFLYGQVGLLADFLSDRPGATSGAGAVAAPAPAAASAASVSTGVPAAVASGAGASPPDWRRQQRDDWNTARAKRQLPPVDGNLWDVLLLRAKDSQAPDSLLVRPDDAPKAWVYHFRYDRTSATPRPLAAAARREEAGEAMPKAALAQQREQPMVVAQLVVVEQPILGAITFISIVSGVIDALQREDPKAGAVAGESLPISLDTLASRYNVIAPSPAWSVVDAAIDRLADAHSRGARYPTQGEDELYVAQFRELLARNLLRIGNALACAAFVGRGRSTSRAARLARGLTVLSRARRFAQRDEEAVGLALEDLTVQVRDAFAVDLTIEWDGAMATYQSAVGAAIDRAEGPLSEQARETLDHVADRAWSGLLDRLERWMSGAPPGAPEVVELLAAAAELGPSKVMGFDPGEMTICDWVRVLAGARGGAAKAPPAPTWLGPIALHALGFHGVNPDLEPARLWLRWPRSGQVGIPDLDEWTRVRALRSSAVLFSGPSPTTTLVVVRRTNSSPKLTTILPMPGIATLIATVDELESIVGNDPAVPPLPLIAPTERQVVAVEMEPELQSKLESELYPRISVAMNPLLVHVYWQDRGREMRHPYVVNPASLMEIVEAAVKENVRLPRKSAPTA